MFLLHDLHRRRHGMLRTLTLVAAVAVSHTAGAGTKEGAPPLPGSDVIVAGDGGLGISPPPLDRVEHPLTAPNAALELPATHETMGYPNVLSDLATGESDLKTTGLSGENIPIERIPRTQRSETDGPAWYRSGIVSLLAVLGVIATAAILVKRFFKGSHVVGSQVLHLLCRTHLSAKQSIALVRMGAKLVFVGITPESIKTLRTVEDREEADLLCGKLRTGALSREGTKFDRLLDREAERFARELDAASQAPPESSEAITRTREDLRGLREKLRSYQGR